MTTSTASPIALPETAPAAARAVFRLLQRLRVGTLDVQLPDGSMAHFGSGGAPRAAMRLHDWGHLCACGLSVVIHASGCWDAHRLSNSTSLSRVVRA